MSYYFKLTYTWTWLVTLWNRFWLTIGWLLFISITVGSGSILVVILTIWLEVDAAIILGIILWFAIVILLIKSPVWRRIVQAMNEIDSVIPYTISVPKDSFAFGVYQDTSLRLPGSFHYFLRPGTRIFLIGSQDEWDHFDPMSQ